VLVSRRRQTAEEQEFERYAASMAKAAEAIMAAIGEDDDGEEKPATDAAPTASVWSNAT
jgi:hypothetical protein